MPRIPKPTLCKTCGETNPSRFSKGNNSTCKSCRNATVAAKRADYQLNPLLGQRKTCTQCQKEKDAFHDFSMDRHVCRSCKNQKDKERNIENYEYELWYSAKVRAAEKHLEFTITPEDIRIPDFCPVLGVALIKRGDNRAVSPSVDRIDNSKGYTPGNIQVISYRANAIKNDATPEEMRRVLAYMEGRLLF